MYIDNKKLTLTQQLTKTYFESIYTIATSLLLYEITCIFPVAGPWIAIAISIGLEIDLFNGKSINDLVQEGIDSLFN